MDLNDRQPSGTARGAVGASSDHRIARLRALPLALPLRGALRWGVDSEMASLEHLLLLIDSDGGARGVAEAPIRPTIYGETAASMRGALAWLEPRLLGLPLDDVAAQDAALAALPFNHALRGALDLALHHLRAAAGGRSLLAAEGGARRRISTSFILGIAPLEEALTEACRVVAAGVGTLKVKVGRDPARDRALLQALRAEFGAAVRLYADANQTLDPAGAGATLTEWARLGVAWVEEPLPVQRVGARRALRAAQIVPLVADDSCFDAAALERELELDTFDVLNVKPPRSGIAGSRRLVALARAAGKGVMVGSQATSGWGTLQSAVVATWEGVDLPCELAFPLKLERDSLTVPLTFEGGTLILPERGAEPRLRPELVLGSEGASSAAAAGPM